MTSQRRRCAIYTRKSTEAGLEQDFNSLDAQREACLAFIKSQKHEGWEHINNEYDDGGFSGGSLERPALQRLLTDIENGLVDVIVVYKIDRLTRSLFDFAKIIELLDSRSASFVSVTQQFNTTTSMGRLTLNVLLSFAQFEREVTGERIRDKIAASKKKGMWMGGCPPLGYDIVDRQLVINGPEADLIRTVFAQYLDLGSVDKLKVYADESGLRTKTWTTRTGVVVKGSKFSRGRLYHLLKNQLYIGRVIHKDTAHQGQHHAIISDEMWSRVQAQLQEQWGLRKANGNKKSPCWLVGILKGENDTSFKSTQTSKNGRLYYYYSNRKEGWRLPSREFEQAVSIGILEAIQDPIRLFKFAGLTNIAAENIALAREIAKSWSAKFGALNMAAGLRPILSEVRVQQSEIKIQILTREFRKLCGIEIIPSTNSPDTEMLYLPVQLKKRGVEARLVLESGNSRQQKKDAKLIQLVARAHVWFEQLKSAERKSVEEIAAADKIDAADISRALPLAFLAPSIIESILSGDQPIDLTAERLRRLAPLPHSWDEQRRVLGF